MTKFDPFTATAAEAIALPEKLDHTDPAMQQAMAQSIIEKKEYFEKNPIRAIGICVRHELIAPDWLAKAFLRQYEKVLFCKVASWDDAFGAPHPSGVHLSTLRLKRKHIFRLTDLFTGSKFEGREKLPRTLEGRKEAARQLGITEKQVRALLPKTRTNTKGHKPYGWKSATAASANDPFSLAAGKVPKK